MDSAEELRQKLCQARLRRLGRVADLNGLQQRLDYLFDGRAPQAEPSGQLQLAFFLPVRIPELIQQLQRKTGRDGWRDIDGMVWLFSDTAGNYTLTLQDARGQCLVVAELAGSTAEPSAPATSSATADIELELN
ncbi:hypothetical protein [Chitinilyticum litopenaei]|uniref:hypothetical protein n=1 Tax=Chitinilyticum litopenaei TaxID=1121276 RepID=UPI0004010AC2|nr:hypothetical protein [Chitinilyticum litopenaei]